MTLKEYLDGDGWKIKLRLSTGVPAFDLSSVGKLGWPCLLDVGFIGLPRRQELETFRPGPEMVHAL